MSFRGNKGSPNQKGIKRGLLFYLKITLISYFYSVQDRKEIDLGYKCQCKYQPTPSLKFVSFIVREVNVHTYPYMKSSKFIICVFAAVRGSPKWHKEGASVLLKKLHQFLISIRSRTPKKLTKDINVSGNISQLRV